MSKDVDFFIVDNDVRPLLGAETCQELHFIKVMVNNIPNSETVNSVNAKWQPKHSVLTEERILKEYSDVFEGLGCMEGLCHLDVDQTVQPVVHPSQKGPCSPKRPLERRTRQASR